MKLLVFFLIVAVLSLVWVLVYKPARATSKFQESNLLQELEKREEELFNDCNYHFYHSPSSLYERKRQELDCHIAMAREQRSYLYECDMTALKMKKSVELYNLLYHLIKTNPHLFSKLQEEPTENGVTILGNVANLSEKERQENKKVFYQVVEDIKEENPKSKALLKAQFQKSLQPTILAQA